MIAVGRSPLATRAGTGTALAALALALAIGATILWLQAIAVGWLDVSDTNTVETDVAVLVLAYGFTVTGLVVIRRLPANPLGWIYLAIGLFEALNLFAGGYSVLAYHTNPSLPLATPLSWVAVWAWVPAFTLFSTFAILLFPNGRMPSARWWPIVALTGVAFVLLFVPVAVATWPYRGATLEAANALNLPPPPDSTIALAFTIQNAAQFLLFAAMAGSIGALIVRFRAAPAVERQQLKWFVVGAMVDLVILAQWIFIATGVALAVLTALVFGLALPVAIGVAILRYHLYDIDRLISRSIAWAILTGLLVAVFGGAVVALEALLSGVTQGETLAVAASTLLAFALFQPLRRTIQRTVDRRFDRAGYDGVRTSGRFGERMRGEVELGALRDDLVATARGSLRPAAADIWLRPRS